VSTLLRENLRLKRNPEKTNFYNKAKHRQYSSSPAMLKFVV
jgi:hypothetical protein